MDSEWFATLVIILSAMLAVFLLLSIIVMVRLVQIIKQVKRIVDHAENAVDKAEEVADFFKKTTTPIALIKLVANISEAMQKTAEKVRKSKK